MKICHERKTVKQELYHNMFEEVDHMYCQNRIVIVMGKIDHEARLFVQLGYSPCICGLLQNGNAACNL